MKYIRNSITKRIFAITMLVSILSFTVSPIITYAQVMQSIPTNSAHDKKTCGVMSMFGQCTPITLNSIGTAAMKMMLKYMTQSIVDWINSGFKGSPTFLSNPSQFFTDMIDEQIGSFIENDPDLNFLCSSMNIDIRLALQLSYSPFKRKISCTLSQVVNNIQNIPNNISINGQNIKSLGGSFERNGGWSNFIQVSQYPQNNTYGAFLTAKTELDARIANKIVKKNNELGQGKGFLSIEKCENDSTGATSYISPITSSSSAAAKRSFSNCSITTPGAVVNDTLSTSLGSGFRQLELADEFDEIINAAVSQLIQQVVTAGISSVSGSGTSDQNNYWNSRGAQLEEQQLNESTYANKESMYEFLDMIKAGEEKYYNEYMQMYNSLFAIKSDYENALTVLENCKTRSLNYNQIYSQIKSTLDGEISTYFTQISSSYNASAALMDQIDNYYTQVDSKKTIEDFKYIAQQATSFSYSLHSPDDVTKAQALSKEVIAKIIDYRKLLSNYSSACIQN